MPAVVKPPEVVQPPPPPPKEKHVLLLERIVKGSDEDLPKSEELSADDSKKVAELNEPLTSVKTDGKITVELLHKMCDAMKSVVKIPENIVKMSVH